MARSIRRSPLGSFLALEPREAPAVFSVTNLADNGAGSLRAAIVQANANPDADNIVFADNLAGGTVGISSIAHTVEGNSALLITSPITIQGNGETISRAIATPFRIFRVASGASLTLKGLTLSNGFVQGGSDAGGINGRGGAVLVVGNFIALDTNFLQNRVVGIGAGLGIGGAIYVQPGATATLTRTLFQGNTATSGPTGPGASGGAVASDGTLNVFTSAFVSNVATAATGNTVAQGRGGGVASFGIGNVINSTFNGNIARSFGPLAAGGGLYNTGTTGVAFSTLAGNAASSSPATNGQGGSAANRGTLTLENSILFGSTAGGSDVYNFFEGTGPAVLRVLAPNIVGTLFNLGGSVLGTGVVSVDPLLGPLQNNGGPTPTMAPQFNSPALNAGATGGGFQLAAVDQRGAGRDVVPDLGAYEVQHPLSPVGVPSDFNTLYGPHPSTTQNQAFIKGLYQAALQRQGSAVEVKFYTDQLAAGTLTRGQAAFNFYNSPENRGNQVRFFYRYFLKREPSQAEVDFYVKSLQAGTDEGAIMTDFVLSPEFAGRNDNTQFTLTLYYAILGRGASPAEVSFYVTRLNNGTATRAQVVQNFVRSPEGIGRVVRGDFLAYLKRVPNTTEVNARLASIQGGTTFGTMAINVLASQEFFDNAGKNL